MDINGLVEIRETVETFRSGPFSFRIGVDIREVETLLLRTSDANQRLSGSPLSQVAGRLEREVIASSVFGTNTIEGGALSEAETARVLDLDPADVQGVEERRAVNLKRAYEIARESAARPGWQPTVEYLRTIHAAISDQIPHDRNRPGELRDNDDRTVTRVGNDAHGGSYRPPQNGHDIEMLLEALVRWLRRLEVGGVPVLIRAPLAHYYFELIHPFWDGNGRVGRVLEATILQKEGFQYAPFAQARYYLNNIHAYFALFNQCRKAGKRGASEFPNTPFVRFFLEGMLECINTLHDRVNDIVRVILFENRVKLLWDEKKINDRQYAIVNYLLENGDTRLSDLRSMPWYTAAYAKLTSKTRTRDLRRLAEQGLIVVADGVLSINVS